MTSLTKFRNPQPKIFFSSADWMVNSFEPWNSSLAQSAEKLGCW